MSNEPVEKLIFQNRAGLWRFIFRLPLYSIAQFCFLQPLFSHLLPFFGPLSVDLAAGLRESRAVTIDLPYIMDYGEQLPLNVYLDLAAQAKMV